MASGYFITGIGTGNLLRLVRRNGIGWHPRYLARFGFLFWCSLWTSALAVVEKVYFGTRIERAECPQDPVIIIGHWRSGTTFIHQLFNAMPGFTAPSMFQVGTPETFLVSEKFLGPLLRMLLPARRSTDNVRFGPDEPQEDEYALFRSTTCSPVEGLIFPQRGRFFLIDRENILPHPRIEAQWKAALCTFCKKLAMKTGGRIVLKNPFHSMRIAYLRELFPKAKFIHIYRNPIHVIPSAMRMWSIEGRHNALREGFEPPSLEDTVAIYDAVLCKIRRDLRCLPDTEYCHLRFEDLEKDPVATVQRACGCMGISLSPEQKQHLKAFVGSLPTYRKNRYLLSEAQAGYIRDTLRHHIDIKAA